MRILVVGHHTYTYGDNAALTCLVDALKKLSPESEITVLSDDPDFTPVRNDVKVRRWLMDSQKFKKVLLRKRNAHGPADLPAIEASLLWWYLTCFIGPIVTSLTWAGLKKRGIGWAPFISTENREILEEFAAADIVLRCPGGSFSDNHPWWDIWRDCLDMFLPRLLGKPTMLCAPSVGPLTSIHRFLAKYVLNRVNLITLRDEFSESALAKMGVTRPPVYTTGDFVTLLQPAPAGRIDEIMGAEGLAGKQPLVGITVIDWHFPGLTDREVRRAQYTRIMAGIADYLASRWQAVVLFIPMSYGPFRETAAIDRIIAHMKHKDRATILREGYNVGELHGIFGRTDFHVGSRVHSVVLNAKGKIPGISIAYEAKIRGFARMVGLEKYVLDIDTLEYDRAIEAIEDAWLHRDDIKRQLAGVFGSIERQALLNAELAIELPKLSKMSPHDMKAHLDDMISGSGLNRT